MKFSYPSLNKSLKIERMHFWTEPYFSLPLKFREPDRKKLLATSWGPTMQAIRGLSLKGRCGYDEE